MANDNERSPEADACPRLGPRDPVALPGGPPILPNLPPLGRPHTPCVCGSPLASVNAHWLGQINHQWVICLRTGRIAGACKRTATP